MLKKMCELMQKQVDMESTKQPALDDVKIADDFPYWYIRKNISQAIHKS